MGCPGENCRHVYSERYVTLCALCSRRFITAFGLTKTDLPTVVAFHPKKLRGAQLKGAYSAQSIDALLDGPLLRSDPWGMYRMPLADQSQSEKGTDVALYV